jgi:hypothetical protein
MREWELKAYIQDQVVQGIEASNELVAEQLKKIFAMRDMQTAELIQIVKVQQEQIKDLQDTVSELILTGSTESKDN